ncbi:MAG: class I SAM-dependent methyltransferase [Armatimonadetes bacterium]|nr:class I SAM-dependent methyltransferase [Armatimonadota bacterium]
MTTDSQNRFDRAAATWDLNPQRIQLAMTTADAIREAVPVGPHMTALEIGCGTGLVTYPLSAHLKSILAVDTSEEMLKILGEKMAQLGVRNVTPLKADLTRDDLPDSDFDLIFSAMAMHHIPDPAGMIRRVAGLLRPGGALCIVDLDSEDGTFHGDSEAVYHHGFGAEEMQGFFAQAGLVELRSETVHVFERPGADGVLREYGVLMTVGRKAG